MDKRRKNGPARRLRTLAARIRSPKTAGAVSNEPPAFPTDALQPPSAELAVPTDARPVPGPRRVNADSPYNFADSTLHIGGTAVPPKASALDAEWQIASRKTDPGRTVLGIDGNTVVVGSVDEDGTVTVVTPAADKPAARRGMPYDCPCTVIYSECRCPVRP